MDASTLRRHAVLKGASPDTISAFINRCFAQHRLRFGEYDRDQQARGYLNHVTFQNISLANMGFGTQVQIDGAQALDDYYLQIVLSGTLNATLPEGAFTVDAGSVLIVNQRQPVKLHHSTDCCKLVVRMGSDIVQQYLTHFLGRTTARPIEFSSFVKLDQPRVGGMVRAIDYICQELEDPYSNIHTISLSRSFEAMLIDALFTSVPHTYMDRVVEAVGGSGPEYLLRAERYIADHLQNDIVLDDIVKASGTSERNLYKAFKAYRNSTPVSHLKVARLRQARLELESLRTPAQTVAEVAMKVGMPHLGNFACDYRQHFGELPSQTLKRRNLAITRRAHAKHTLQ